MKKTWHFLACIPFLFISLDSLSHDDKDDEIVKILEDNSLRNERPSIVSKQAVEDFFAEGKKWEWITINGVDVGHSSKENLRFIKKTISYNSKENKKNKDNKLLQDLTASINVYGIDAAEVVKYFNSDCKSKILFDVKLTNKIYITTYKPISKKKVCLMIVDALSLNGMNIKYDNNNWIIE